jgi:adenylate cyclase
VAYRVAAVYVALGDKNQAIEWLNKSYDLHENYIPFIKTDPAMTPLRSDPRFIELLAKLRLT